MKNNWTEEDKRLIKTFQFSGFVESIEFVNKVAKMAEEANHHPDVLIFDYKKVKLMLTTHTEAKVTQKDFDLAKKLT